MLTCLLLMQLFAVIEFTVALGSRPSLSAARIVPLRQFLQVVAVPSADGICSARRGVRFLRVHESYCGDQLVLSREGGNRGGSILVEERGSEVSV